MVVFYAILDENDICNFIVSYGQELENAPSNYVAIDEGQDVLWRKYENGKWSEEKYLPPEPEPQPTLDELIYAENLYQTALLELQMMGVE